MPQQPTIPITRARSVVAPAATIPLGPRISQGIDLNESDVPSSGAAGQTVVPRDIIQEDRDRLAAAQNKHIPLGKRILEGLGTYAASGVGLNLRPILHPHGTETEQAQRQLATDIALQKARTDQEQGQVDVEDKRATIALRGAQARKIDADLQDAIRNPDTSAEAKRIAEGLGAFKGQLPSPENDAAYARLRQRAARIGIELPETYGEQPKQAGPHNPLLRERRNADGTTSTLQSDDYGKTWYPVKDLTSAAPPEKPDKIGTRQQQENERKRVAYEAETKEWEGKESTYRQNKVAEDKAIQTKRDQMQKLYDEKRSWTPTLLGGRSNEQIQADIDRLSAEIKTHKANSQEFQKRADDAASEATRARRNAGLYTGGTSQGSRPTRSAKPGSIQANEDPNIRDYANHFFGGDYQKAQAAIRAQRSKK